MDQDGLNEHFEDPGFLECIETDPKDFIVKLSKCSPYANIQVITDFTKKYSSNVKHKIHANTVPKIAIINSKKEVIIYICIPINICLKISRLNN